VHELLSGTGATGVMPEFILYGDVYNASIC
jgi:hypothetical protein